MRPFNIVSYYIQCIKTRLWWMQMEFDIKHVMQYSPEDKYEKPIRLCLLPPNKYFQIYLFSLSII